MGAGDRGVDRDRPIDQDFGIRCRWSVLPAPCFRCPLRPCGRARSTLLSQGPETSGRSRHGIEAPVPVDDGVDHRDGIGERPALPACGGVGEHLEPGRVFEGASRPWIHCQTRPRPVWPEGEPDSELGDEERSCTGVGPSGHDDGGPPPSVRWAAGRRRDARARAVSRGSGLRGDLTEHVLRHASLCLAIVAQLPSALRIPVSMGRPTMQPDKTNFSWVIGGTGIVFSPR